MNYSKGKRYIYAFVRKTWWNGGAFFFGFGKEDGKLFDGGHGDVAPVVAGKERLWIYKFSDSYTQDLFISPCPSGRGRKVPRPSLRWWLASCVVAVIGMLQVLFSYILLRSITVLLE